MLTGSRLLLSLLFFASTQWAAAEVHCSRFLEGHHLGVALDYQPAGAKSKMPGQTQQVISTIYDPNSNETILRRRLTYWTFFNKFKTYFGKEFLHDAGLRAIYSNYGHRVDDRVVQTVIEVEKQLPLDRQSTYMVFDHSNLYMAQRSSVLQIAKGFIRVFDGSVYRDKNDSRARSSQQLPLERILEAQGKQTHVVEMLRRENNRVFEIGKYFIEKDLEVEDSHVVRRSILRWLRERILQLSPEDQKKTYFFCHVVSRAHRIAYERFFGFKVADEKLSSNLDENEVILLVSAEDLLAKLGVQTASRKNEPRQRPTWHLQHLGELVFTALRFKM